MSRTLLILNDPPYGTERSYNGLRLAGSLAKREGQAVLTDPTPPPSVSISPPLVRRMGEGRPEALERKADPDHQERSHHAIHDHREGVEGERSRRDAG